jgi:hypothetical protein
MSETIGISSHERWPPVMHPSCANTAGWHVSDDITPERLALIIENIEDLFT